MRFETIDEDHKDYLKTKELYELSFPPQEICEFELLVKRPKNITHILGCYDDDDTYIGFVVLYVIGDIAHIVYFAVDRKQRDKGYGTQILKQLSIDYKDYRIIADVEKVEDNVSNNDQRIKRMSFYTKNGYKPSGIEYNWNGDDYLILIDKGEIAREEFGNFWRQLDKLTNGDTRGF